MKRQRGAALMVILLIAGVLAAFFAVRALNGANTERDKVTAAALAQAKDALIGYSVAYRDTHPNQVNGYLLLPDLGTTKNLMPGLGEGASAGNFLTNSANLSVVGRLPWRSLGLPALRDSQGACLWYAVSGAYQNEQTAPLMNWDTLGQFDTFRSNGTPAGTISTVGANLHNRPVAVIFAPGSIVAGQARGPIGADVVTECGGNYDARNYLDTFNPSPLINNIVNYFGGLNFATGIFPLATPKQLILGPVRDGAGTPIVNDRILAITSDELFRSIKRRNDFKTDIDSMLEDIAQCLNNLPPASLPIASLTNKGVGDFPAAVPPPPDPTPLDVLSRCRPIVQQKLNVLQNWQDNLLYTRPAVAATVGASSCNAVLFFSGERTANQARATAADRLLAANYLEGTNATLFPASGAYTGASGFNSESADVDIVRCIKGFPAGGSQQSFANDFASFIAVGVGVTTNAATQTVSIDDAPGIGGGCFWSPTIVPLAGKIIRAYYDYRFRFIDPFALTGIGADRGNGFSLQMVTGQFAAPPNTCGTEANMGVLGAADVWGADSIIFETDVHRDAARADPVENHSAILLDGFLDHAPASPGATISAACNGTATGCRHAPADKFEESPPIPHNQRIEIHSGCDAACTACNPLAHVAPNNFARVTVWVDCSDCKDTATDVNRVSTVPTIQRCMVVNPEMNSVYFGFTGGFRSGVSQQGVTLTNLVMRSE